MPHPVRYNTTFANDLAARVRWLQVNRPAAQRANLRAALATFRQLIGSSPVLGVEVALRRTRSYRVFTVGGGLPYLVWYHYDTADERAPVWLAMLMHESQDRERFSPGRFE